MRYMKHLITVILLYSSINLMAQTPTKWDLQSCVQYAIQHNISVQQADIQARIAKLQATLAKSNQLPTISGNTGMGLRLGRSIDPTTNGFSNTQFLYNNFGVNGGMQLFNAGRLKNSAEASSLSWYASETDKQTIANDISLNVATFYLQILSAIEQSEIAKIQIQQTKEQLVATSKRVEVGLLPELNLLELETQLANDSSSYISAMANVQQGKLNLMALLNLDASQNFDIVAQPVDQIKLQSFADLQPDYVFNFASQNLPNVKAAALRVKAAQKKLDDLNAVFYRVNQNYQFQKAIYDTDPGDVFFASSDVGWVVGHSYIVYAPLIQGATTIVFEGKPVGTPDAGTFWRVIAEHGVSALFTAPTAFRAIRKEDPEGHHIRKHDLSSLRTLFLAGERADPETVKWAEDMLKVPVVDHWWQTETGWAITSGFRQYGLFPFLPGSGGRPCPGYDLHALDDDGNVLPRGTTGNLSVRLPLPPG